MEDENVNVGVDPDAGGVWVELGPETEEPDSDEHNQNLAEILPESVLTALATELLDKIADDDQSRSEWLLLREKAIGLLGVKINDPKGSPVDGGASFEGMSTYQDSALLEAAIRFQANARGELLPAEGPVKVKNDGEQNDANNAQAEALEKASNKYLTVTATEYVPDSDRLFFQTGWSGIGIKKGFHCPIRRRPVIESVDAKDLIVSNNLTDIDSGRVTHVIKMSKTVLIRMQIAGAYRIVELDQSVADDTPVDKKIASTQGVSKATARPENLDRTLYETYDDLDIPGFEHELKGKRTGLPIPYRVVIDKTSRKILEIRRNWKDSDEQCIKRKTFIVYPFIPWMGFYPLGLMHVLGNTTNIITAAIRILIDNGMYSNFNAWVYAKTGQGQDKTDFRVGPGQGIPFNLGPGEKLGDRMMPLPTKPIDPSFLGLVEALETRAQRLGGTAEVQVGEGNQQAPVGTTIALIEQAMKVMSAVHKRLHQAQSEEFRLFQELLREDVEALWRADGKEPFNAELIKQAINNFELSPRADPNVASHMIRLAKAEAARQVVKDAPDQWDVKGALEWYCDQIGIPELKRFVLPPPPPQAQQPNPDAIKAGTAMQIQQMKSSDAAQDRALQAQQMAMKAQGDAADRQAKAQQQQMELARDIVIHPASQPMVQSATTPEIPGITP